LRSWRTTVISVIRTPRTLLFRRGNASGILDVCPLLKTALLNTLPLTD
jgi:hypothetical protein